MGTQRPRRALVPLASGVLLAAATPPAPSPLLPFVALVPLAVYLMGTRTDARAALAAIRAGMLADLAIIGENPVQNLKVLYGTGAVRLNDKTGRAERVGGVLYTVKDGIIYDARQLRKDVEKMVQKQKRERGVR